MPKISVIVCTYNRADSLKDTLNCLLTQELKEDFEVIVVDNNSQDNTRSAVGSLSAGSEGKLRYFFEPRQGKTFALNLGIKEAQGEIIVFNDDDVLMKNDYLSNINETFGKYADEIGIIGGKIAPQWTNGSKPEWFVDLNKGWWSDTFFKGPAGIYNYGDEPFIIDHARGIHKNITFYGANTAIRKKILEQCGYFNTEKTVGEDTEMCLRIFRAGVKGLYMPTIIVQHKIDAQKLTPELYYRWYYLRGKLLEIHDNYQKKFYHPFGISWALIAVTTGLWIRSIFALSLTRKIYYRSRALFNFGQITQIVNKK